MIIIDESIKHVSPGIDSQKIELENQKEDDFDSDLRIKIEYDLNRKPSMLRIQVENMLDYFMRNFGRVGKQEMKLERNFYKNNKKLQKLFDALVDKYQAASKGKEDIIRFVLRKALTYLRDIERNENKISMKDASIKLCKQYFPSEFDALLNNAENKGRYVDYDKILNHLLPYKKNSRNKTANNSFISEIFSSPEFIQDYRKFLSEFPRILENDSMIRAGKFCDFLVEVVQDGKVKKVRNFKRPPWLDSWIEDTKEIANNLLNPKILNEIKPKPRKQNPKSNFTRKQLKTE